MRSARFALLLLIAALPFAASAQTSTQFVEIVGDPLTIHVAPDASFQVFNASVPGTGQIFPQDCAVADMGLFATIDGTLFSPDFSSHPCGTATQNLGTYTAWQPLSISTVTGDGEATSPFTVSLLVSAPTVDVLMSVTVTYVSGDNFFRIASHFFSNVARQMNVFLGADIFLASSDAGVFFFEPALGAPGGRDCGEQPTYNILLIPITRADRYTADQFQNVWTQIAEGTLNNQSASIGCVDNGAALEWEDVFNGQLTADVISAISFGQIPPASAFAAFTMSIDPDFVALGPGESTTLTLRTVHNSELNFNSPIDLITANLPPGISVTLDRSRVPAPGSGTVQVTVTVAPDIFPDTYHGLAIVGSGGGERGVATFSVQVECFPPLILGLPSSNPLTQSVKGGASATLSVKPQGGGAFTYQWFRGHTGITSFPMANSNSAQFTTPPINGTEEFWVRVSNACGTADSRSAVITPTP